MGLITTREDETKAATIGINLPVEKIVGFVASSVLVGMASAVYGYYLTFVDPRGMFSILLSVQIVLSLLVGGRGTLWVRCSARFLFGGLLVLVAIFLPTGHAYLDYTARVDRFLPGIGRANSHLYRRLQQLLGSTRAACILSGLRLCSRMRPGSSRRCSGRRCPGQRTREGYARWVSRSVHQSGRAR